jgi:hypothetical protein
MSLARKIKKFIPAVLGLLSSAALFLIISFPGRAVFFIVLILWLFILSLIEWQELNYLFILLIGIVVMVLFQSLFGEGNLMQIQQKPYRRIMTLLWSFDAYALVTALFAVGLFFLNIPFLLITVVAGVIFALISFMIWSMYFHLSFRQSSIWLFLVLFLMIQIVWTTHLLPFGYLVSGFFVTWIWCILQLLIRFHFSPKGVIWKRQFRFLSLNALLFAGLLVFFVRWV